MKTTSAFSYFLIVIIFFLFSCEKEFSSENNIGTSSSSGTSSFTFVDANTNCSSPVINSTYTINKPANSNNTVQLMVKVTAIGSYSVSTPLINGISFTATGTFTSLGIQPIVFLAKGTPIVRGKFPYSPGTNGCSFPITINDTGSTTNSTPPAGSTPDTNGILSCKIDGTINTFNYHAIASTTTQGFSYLNIGGYQTATSATNVPQLQIYITKNDNGNVSAGTYNEKGFISPTGYSIEIDYQFVNSDQSLTIFNTSSNILPPNHPPFTIVITSITATRVKGTFSGQLTNTMQGNTITKTITEGSFDEPIQ